MSADHHSPFDLEHLKKHAKRLLRACRVQDNEALATVQAVLPRLRGLTAPAAASTIRLADVHHALALERGFRSWADLTRVADPLARLLTAVRGGHTATFRRDLHDFSGLASANVFAACVLGDATALRAHLEHEAALATTPRDGWTPLDYVCSSPLARLSSRHAASLCDCAALLLAAGADPHTAVVDGRLPGTPLPAVMRAMLAGSLGLVALLRTAGAQEPHEAIQQWAATRTDPASARLQQLFRDYFRRPETQEQLRTGFAEFKARGGSQGPTPTDPRELTGAGMPSWNEARSQLWPVVGEALSTMLDGGYDPRSAGVTGRSTLHTFAAHAPASAMEMLLHRGIGLDARDANGRSVLATAVRAGNRPVVELLRSRGVEDDSTLMDRLIGVCVAGDAAAAQDLVVDHPDIMEQATRADVEELVLAAARGNIDQVRLMLACGFPADAAGESGATALHQAAWRGHVAIVELMLARGASPVARDALYGETAGDWARHGAAHAQGAQDPCLESARLIEGATAG